MHGGPQEVGQLLDQVAPQVHVERLHPPADGQDREVPLEGRAQQAQFELVAHPAGAAVARVGIGTVAGGVDVPPADEDQPVEDRGHPVVAAGVGWSLPPSPGARRSSASPPDASTTSR